MSQTIRSEHRTIQTPWPQPTTDKFQSMSQKQTESNCVRVIAIALSKIGGTIK
jgi:hypothetical protein